MNNLFALIPVLAVLLAIVATVLAFVFIVPEKKKANLNKLGRFLHDTFNFKYLIIEKILQALYIFATAFVILMGFFMLFYVQPGYETSYYSVDPVWYGGYGLLMMILGPIAVRLGYEFLMMIILLIKNVIQINNKLKGGDEQQAAPESIQPEIPQPAYSAQPDHAANPFNVIPTYTAPVAPVAPEAPVAASSFCPNCGNPIEGGSFCPNCGTQI